MNENPRGFVDYVLQNGQCRPFLIVRAWSDVMINGILFVDGRNDYLDVPYWTQPPNKSPNEADLTIWRTSIHFSADNEPNTWHYPE